MGDETPLMYGSLAEWFHLLTSPDEYAAEAAEVLRLLETHTLPPLHDALELGSGDGNLVTLTDPSSRMLQLSRSINPAAEHLEGDMRTLRLGRTFDDGIAHDAIVYMTSEADLRSAFEIGVRPAASGTFEAEQGAGGAR